jgi:hypothetical protein
MIDKIAKECEVVPCRDSAGLNRMESKPCDPILQRDSVSFETDADTSFSLAMHL